MTLKLGDDSPCVLLMFAGLTLEKLKNAHVGYPTHRVKLIEMSPDRDKPHIVLEVQKWKPRVRP